MTCRIDLWCHTKVMIIMGQISAWSVGWELTRLRRSEPTVHSTTRSSLHCTPIHLEERPKISLVCRMMSDREPTGVTVGTQQQEPWH